MRPTAWTGGLAAVAGVLGVVGLYLDAPAAAGAAGGLAALLSVRAVLFLSRVTRYVDGLDVSRAVAKEMVRQGAPVEVEVRATAPAVQGLSVELEDLPPRSASYSSGDQVLREGRARYRVRFLAPGGVAFRGVEVRALDPFFSTDLLCTAPRYAGTPLTVLPSGAHRPEIVTGAGTGEFERERKAVMHGQGVRSYRPYLSGDDLALIDWKLSAKHSRYFVREPTSLVGGAPLLVVDLPFKDAPGEEPLLTAAGEAIEQEVRAFGRCSLLVVAGGEVVAWRYHDQDLPGMVRLLAPREEPSVVPFYRLHDPAFLRQQLRGAEHGTTPFSRHLAVALRGSLGARRPLFEEEVEQILAGTEHQEVVVYSAAVDEVSHLNLIAAAARRRGRSLRLRLPNPERGALAGLSPYGRVEAL